MNNTDFWTSIRTIIAEGFTSESLLKLDFYAVSPASVKSLTTLANTNKKVAAFSATSVPSMVDLCYASAINQTADANATVNLKFKHALSQITFLAKKDNDMVVEINEIQLRNLINGGDYALPTNIATDATSQNGVWTLGTNTSSYPGFTVTGSPIAIPDANAGDAAKPFELTKSGEELLIIPQSTISNAWDPTKVTDATAPHGTADATTKVVLRIQCRVSRGGTWLLGSATTFEWRNFPINVEYKQGYKYKYILLFGGVKDDTPGEDTGDNPGEDTPGGYEDDGKVAAPTVPIRFNATAIDWTDAVSDVTF